MPGLSRKIPAGDDCTLEQRSIVAVQTMSIAWTTSRLMPRRPCDLAAMTQIRHRRSSTLLIASRK